MGSKWFYKAITPFGVNLIILLFFEWTPKGVHSEKSASYFLSGTKAQNKGDKEWIASGGDLLRSPRNDKNGDSRLYWGIWRTDTWVCPYRRDFDFVYGVNCVSVCSKMKLELFSKTAHKVRGFEWVMRVDFEGCGRDAVSKR